MTKKKITPRLYLGIESKYLSKTHPSEWKEYQKLTAQWYNQEPSPPWKPAPPPQTMTQHVSIKQVEDMCLADILDLCTEKGIPFKDIAIRSIEHSEYGDNDHWINIYHIQEIPNPNIIAAQRYYDDAMRLYQKKLIKYKDDEAKFEVKRARVVELMKLFDKTLQELISD